MTDDSDLVFVIKVPKEEAEHMRKKLMKKNLLNHAFIITADVNHVYLPVSTSESVAGYQPFKKELKIRKKTPTLEEYLEKDIPSELQAHIPSSIDYIGKKVALVKLAPEMEHYKSKIGKGILKTSKVKAVYLKMENISGTYRTTDYELIAGEPVPYPIHQEHGVLIQVDIQHAYFNPRLGNEHHRVATLVEASEKVLDMFSGVGPFALHIAKHVEAEVVAVDINPAAIKCLEQSIELQSLKGVIEPFVGDISDIILDISTQFDHIIMNLPGSAKEYLDLAANKVKKAGYIHFYQFISAKDEIEALELGENIIHDILGSESFVIENLTKLRDIAPHKFQICADIKRVS